MKINKPIKDTNNYIYIEGTIRSIIITCVDKNDKKENGYSCTLIIDLYSTKTNKESITINLTKFFKLEHIVEFNDYKDKYTLDEKVITIGYINKDLKFNIIEVCKNELNIKENN